MRFTKIRLKGPTNIDLPLEDATPSGPYIMKEASGLGPVDVFVRDDGTTAPLAKEMVFKIGLQPAWNLGHTAETLRTEIYGLLTPKYGQPITVQIMDGGTVLAEIDCQVKKCEPVLFSKDPEVQLTMSSSYSFFKAPAIVWDEPDIPAPVGGKIYVDVLNEGTAPTGFRMKIKFTTAVDWETEPFVVAQDSDLGDTMVFNRDFAINDVLTFDTREGSRGVWRTAAGGSSLTPILNDLSDLSPWIQLHNGVNTLVFSGAEFEWDDDGVGLTPAYWGV